MAAPGEFSPLQKIQTGSKAHQTSYSIATEATECSFPDGVERLTTHLYLLLRLGMSGAIHLLPQFSALNFTKNTSCTSLMHDTLMGCVPVGSTLASSPQLPTSGSNIK